MRSFAKRWRMVVIKLTSMYQPDGAYDNDDNGMCSRL